MPDVVVIGGGPAGCAAAITLARRGRSVVLLERNRKAVDGFCGEFLSPDGVGSLDLLDALEPVLDHAPPKVTDWRLHGARRRLGGALPAPALGISRRALDPTLRAVARAAGVDVRAGETVRRVDGDARRGLEVTTVADRIACDHVIGAVGRASRLPGIGLGARAGQREYVAFKAHFRAADPIPEIRLYALGGAYVGVGPVDGERINVCYLARRKAFTAAGSEPAAVLEEAAGRLPDWAACWRSLERLSDRWLSTGGLYFGPRVTEVRPGVTLCGDAAGVITPFLGEGMSMALEGGCLAGRRVDAGFDDPEALARDFPAIWRQRFAARMRWGERIQRLLLSGGTDAAVAWSRVAPGLPRLVVERSRSPELTQRGAEALRRMCGRNG